jgi:hypothetical protein
LLLRRQWRASIGLAIEAAAHELVENGRNLVSIPATHPARSATD